MEGKILRNVMLAAGAMNVGGVVLFSRAFTNKTINEMDPVVMSNFGLLMIVVWGLAYWGAAFIRGNISWLLAAFAIEKLVYVIAWVKWLLGNGLSSVYEQDTFAGAFYSIYGLNDFVFMLFFGWACVSQRRGAE